MEETAQAQLTEAIRELLEGGREERLADVLAGAHPADVSRVIRELPLEDQVRVFRLLTPQQAGAGLAELDDPILRELIGSLDEAEVSRALDRMPSDEGVNVVEELPKEQAEELLDLMEEEKAEEVQELLEYPERTAGRLMSPDFVAVPETVTVARAIEHIRKAKTGDGAFYVYVVDDHDHLVGFVPLHRLITADPAAPIRTIRTEDVESVTVDTDQEEVARLVQRYNVIQIPVVDANRRLLGTIGVEDVLDVLREEATEDIQRLGGVGDMTATVLQRVLWKELWLGFTTGVANGLVIAAIAWAWKGQALLALILGLALVFNMLVAAVVGTLIPVALKMFRIDPAIASS